MGSWFKNFKESFKVVIVHPETFEERGNFSLSKMSFFTTVVVYTVFIIAVTTVLIFFTPLREIIPGYTDVTLNRRVYNMEQRADSLETALRQNEVYIQNMKRIIMDDDFDLADDNTLINIRKNKKEEGTAGVVNDFFFTPINGMITSHFDSNRRHYGVDVVANTDAVIKAIADGTVVFSDWSAASGYIIGIQHNRNLISVYKHNASLLHNEGDVVKAGDGIAVIGGGGSTSTGPHLHFEMWFKGMPLNPEDYISFEGK